MIHPINLAAIDLNLLVVFDAIMTERHVTRASMRLGLSQPATSNALARLRSLVEDELFIRTSGGLQPTPKAISLAQQIQPALQQIQAALVVFRQLLGILVIFSSFVASASGVGEMRSIF